MNLDNSRRFSSHALAAGLLALVASQASPGSAQTGLSSGFANPPLRYEGPDPTANYFLPSNTELQLSAMPSSATVTPLPPPEFSATSPAARSPAARSPAARSPAARLDSHPETLTPSALIRQFSLPGLSLPDQAGPGRTIPQPELVTPRTYGIPPGAGEQIFPAERLDEPGTSYWPSDDQSIDPLELLNGGITEHKEGFFQSFSVTGTWIDRNSKPDDFGITELDIKGTFALPLPTREWPLLITPAFNTRFLDGPTAVNLPPRLYETYVDFTWVPRLSARWTGILGVAPSIYSDLEQGTDGFRVTGKGLARYDWYPGQLQVIFGVLYLGRQDVKIMPAGGLIWTPNDRQKYELLFPRPKLAHLIRREARFEDWLYLGAEFGGNSYAIQLPPGTPEIVTLRDYRAYVGLERKLNGGAGIRLEVGYAFGRVIEFASGLPELQADDTAMIRGGIIF